MFNIIDYLNNNGFELNIDYMKYIKEFISQMEDKILGYKSSLGMLNSHIHINNSFDFNKKVIVIDAGGTNLRISTVSFDKNKKIVIEDIKKTIMPGVDSEVSKDEFYHNLAKEVLPFDNFSNKVGFCFSYPVELEDSNDGKILRMCKEIKAPEIVNTYVCKNLDKHLITLGGNSKEYTLLNDSTASLLAGMSNSEEGIGGYIGLILGTGSNSCYVNNDGYIYNLESGWYDSFPRGKFDKMLDQQSINPGKYYLEKSTSGAYLGPLVTIVLKDLYSKGIIKSNIKELNTKEINDFLLGKIQICNSDENELFLSVINRVVDRAALYISLNIAALIIKTGVQNKTILIVADGSTFHNLKDFQIKIENNLNKILTSDYLYKIVSIENAPVVGAGIAALLD